MLAHEICGRLDDARKQGTIAGIKSDGKAQVTVRYDQAGQPVAIETVVVSIQHDPAKDLDELAAEVKTLIVARRVSRICRSVLIPRFLLTRRACLPWVARRLTPV